MKTADLTPEMIDVNYPQPVRRENCTDDFLLGMGKSLLEKQLNPIYVMKNRKVVAGNSRILAARMVKKSHLWGYMLDADLSESEQLQWMCFENVHRVEVTVQEQTKQCLRLLELNPEWEQKQAAAFLKLDPSMVTRFVAVGKAIPAVQDAFYSRAISLSATYEIVKAGDAAAQHAALAKAYGGATREEIRKRGASGQSGQTRLKVPFGGMAVSISGKGVELKALEKVLGGLLKSVKKAISDGWQVTTWEAALKDTGKSA